MSCFDELCRDSSSVRVRGCARGGSDNSATIKVGDPSETAVKMGPLANATQLRDMHAELEALKENAELFHADGGRGSLLSSLYTDDLESAGVTV